MTAEPEDRPAGVVVSAHFPTMAWTLHFTKLTVEVDGAPHRGRWRRRFVPMEPGEHLVTVFFGYVGMPRCGEASVNVSIPEGARVVLAYRAPALMTGPGKLEVRR